LRQLGLAQRLVSRASEAGAIVGAALVVHDHLTPAMILLTAVVLATAAGYAVRPEPEAPRRAA
jgi:hypothetical protein